MQFQKAQQFVLDKLKTELPEFLVYHNMNHTNEVVNYVEQIADGKNVSGNELTTRHTTALLHDTGFPEAYGGHKGFCISDIVLILIGVLTAGFLLKSFLVPNDFFMRRHL